ncbi:MAG: CDP-glycerol glycerophosphotransferase family protein [Terriglobia bacterium]
MAGARPARVHHPALPMSDNGRRRLLFHAALPHHFIFFRPVYERLAGDARLEWNWSANFLGWQLKKHLMDLFPIEGKKISSVVSATRSYDLLISPIYLKLDVAPRARQRVQIFHGCAIYNCWLKPLINDYDCFFMVGPYMVRRFAEKGFLQPDDPRIRLVGMPKLDPLANGNIDSEALRAELDLDPDLPTILYAPSGIGSSLYSHGRDLIKRVSRMPVNLLVKLHDKTRDFRRNFGDWLWRMRKHHGQRVRVLEGFEIVPYLALADLLITDFSSVANEFLLRDKPIVFLPTPDKLDAYREMWDLEGYKIGTMVHSEGELLAAIEDGLARPERMSAIRRQAAAEIFYRPGTATERAVELVYERLEMNPPTPASN